MNPTGSKFLRDTLIMGVVVMSIGSAGRAQQNDSPRYRRQSISNARFGEGERQMLLQKAYHVAEEVNKELFGQEKVSKILQDRLTQYFENFGSRTGEPIALNMIGLPGVGKTAMLTKLKEMGFPIVHFDAQKFAPMGDRTNNFVNEAYSELISYSMGKKPVILIVEELDKVPELVPGETEKSSTLIGALNQILSDGRLGVGGRTSLDLSNIMVLTTMNFAPGEMEHFTGEVLKEQKSYYDFTLEDFQKFDAWVRNQSSARYKILSRMFRTNTVSRLSPNTVVMQPLDLEGYRKIVSLMVSKAIKRNSTGANAGKRISVEIDPSVYEFLTKETTFAPSGARETVFRSDALIDQLIKFGIKAQDPGERSADRPRKIKIAIDPITGISTVHVTPMIQHGKKLDEGAAFSFDVSYDKNAKLFSSPNIELAIEKPVYDQSTRSAPRVTQKQVHEARFPKAQTSLDNFTQRIGQTLFDQQEAINTIKSDLEKYFARQGPAKKEPSYRVLSGFPGIGKSEIVKLVAQDTQMPVVRINMQQFSSDSAETVKSFFATLEKGIEEAQQKSVEGRYILLIEELDKTFEIDPKGNVVNRPIMGFIKDLMNDGVITLANSDSGYSSTTLKKIDIRPAFMFVTMNFSVDLFKFKADPRMTSVEDVLGAWKRMKSTPMNIKETLGSIFLPETVSRLMSRFIIMKPLDRANYAKIIDAQVENISKSRLLTEKGVNVGQIEIKLTDNYKKYLFDESVVPSEGARNTVIGSQAMIASDLEKALGKLPKSSKYAVAPLILTLDYISENQSVSASVVTQKNPTETPKKVTNYQVALKFPPMNVDGKMSPERIHVTAHEFGHAFVAARLGLRFEHVVVVSPGGNTGGYVKFKNGDSNAMSSLASVYATLGSRALERMTLTKNALDPNSVLQITSGPSNDIQQASVALYNMLYELGFDPNGGTVDRNFLKGPMKYAAFSEMPAELAEKFGLILRDMENSLVESLTKAHSQNWYVKKIVELGRAGAMTEEQFYRSIEYRYPGEGQDLYSHESALREMFAGYVKDEPAAASEARRARQGNLQMTAEETMKAHLAVFAEIVRNRLHPEMNVGAVGPKYLELRAESSKRTSSAARSLMCSEIFSRQ